MLGLGFGRNGRKVTEVIIFTSVGDGFEVFGISTVGDADTGDLTLLGHIYSLLFFYNRIIRKLIPGDPAALFYKTDDPFCISICLRNLIQCVFNEITIFRFHHPFQEQYLHSQKMVCNM